MSELDRAALRHRLATEDTIDNCVSFVQVIQLLDALDSAEERLRGTIPIRYYKEVTAVIGQTMVQTIDGEYVSRCDLEALKQERDTLKAKLREALDANEGLAMHNAGLNIDNESLKLKLAASEGRVEELVRTLKHAYAKLLQASLYKGYGVGPLSDTTTKMILRDCDEAVMKADPAKEAT